MDSIFPICQFQNGPITPQAYLEPLEALLRAEVSPTVTTKDVQLYEKRKAVQAESKSNDKSSENGQVDEENDEEELETNGTTPLHAICASLDPQITGEELEVVLKMIDMLFEWGAGWMICKFSAFAFDFTHCKLLTARLLFG